MSTMSRRRVGLIAVIAVALAALLGTAAWAAYSPRGPGGATMGGATTDYGAGMMNGPGMVNGAGMMHGRAGMMSGAAVMDGSYGMAGTGPVTSLEQARAATQGFADRLDLEVGEVMQFSNGYYAELRTSAGEEATEVLVDTENGDVRIEYGPAMMWNTEYGMHAAGSTSPERVSPDAARKLANEWLIERGSGLTAGEAEAFPGYYTLHTQRDDKVTGMLSVNADTGAVWYHSWHGEFVDMSEE